jgi:hypothetical protein
MLIKKRFAHMTSVLMLKPGGVAVKHSGLWTRRREFESLPGYHPLECDLYFSRWRTGGSPFPFFLFLHSSRLVRGLFDGEFLG